MRKKQLRSKTVVVQTDGTNLGILVITWAFSGTCLSLSRDITTPVAGDPIMKKAIMNHSDAHTLSSHTLGRLINIPSAARPLIEATQAFPSRSLTLRFPILGQQPIYYSKGGHACHRMCIRFRCATFREPFVKKSGSFWNMTFPAVRYEPRNLHE